MFSSFISLIRPHQWLKNGFVFLPMFFGGRITDLWCCCQAIIAFFAFSFAASAVYCLNDIIDVEADRKHPVKCKRPIACRAVTIPTAVMIALVCIGLSLLLCFCEGRLYAWKSLSIIVLYLITNVLYCFRLKQIAIIDVMLISFGFVLRLALGGVACNILLSPWIVSLTFLIALLLAFTKRRDDVILVKEGEKVMRKSIVNYNIPFLDQTLAVLAAITIVSYIMYTVSPDVTARIGSDYVYASSVFVIGGILRYLQDALVFKRTGSPTKVLIHDRFIQSMIILWIITFLFLLYL